MLSCAGLKKWVDGVDGCFHSAGSCREGKSRRIGGCLIVIRRWIWNYLHWNELCLVYRVRDVMRCATPSFFSLLKMSRLRSCLLELHATLVVLCMRQAFIPSAVLGRDRWRRSITLNEILTVTVDGCGWRRLPLLSWLHKLSRRRRLLPKDWLSQLHLVLQEKGGWDPNRQIQP